MSEVTAFIHPRAWLALGRWQRERLALRWKMVLDHRVPPERVYLGRHQSETDAPNGVFGCVFLKPRRHR